MNIDKILVYVAASEQSEATKKSKYEMLEAVKNLQITDNLHEADFIIASTVDKAMKPIMEIGMAYAWSIPIIVYFPNDKNLPVNLMLAQSSVAVATSAEQLNNIVAKLVENGFDFDKIRETFEGAVE